MKKTKPTKKSGGKKMSLLSQRKTITDKFFDVLKAETKVYPVIDKKTGRVKIKKNGKEDFRRKGTKKFADSLGVSVSRVNSIIKKGILKDNGDYLITGIEKVHSKLKLPKTKKTTKEFTVHNFTFENFFKRKPFGKIKKNEQLYFRAGLYLVFNRVKSVSTGITPNPREKLNMDYVIQNFPISHYSNLYPQGYTEFFEIIQIKLMEYPSLKFFRFNYFDVDKIDIGTIEERSEKFEAKHKANNLKTQKRKNAKRKK